MKSSMLCTSLLRLSSVRWLLKESHSKFHMVVICTRRGSLSSNRLRSLTAFLIRLRSSRLVNSVTLTILSAVKRECLTARGKGGPRTTPTSLAAWQRRSRCTETTTRLTLRTTPRTATSKSSWTERRSPTQVPLTQSSLTLLKLHLVLSPTRLSRIWLRTRSSNLSTVKTLMLLRCLPAVRIALWTVSPSVQGPETPLLKPMSLICITRISRIVRSPSSCLMRLSTPTPLSTVLLLFVSTWWMKVSSSSATTTSLMLRKCVPSNSLTT